MQNFPESSSEKSYDKQKAQYKIRRNSWGYFFKVGEVSVQDISVSMKKLIYRQHHLLLAKSNRVLSKTGKREKN